MQRNKIIKVWAGAFLGLFITTTLVGSFFVVANISFAATDYLPLTTIPGATTVGTPANPTDLIKNAYSISIGIAAILAVIMIIWGGIQYATTEAITGKSDAKDHIKSALFGLVLLVGSYLILKTINSQLVNINLDLGAPVVSNSKVSGGDDIYSQILNQQQQQIAQASTDLQTSKQATQTAQENLDKLKTSRDEINKQLATMNGASSEARALVAQGLALDKQINTAEEQVQIAQANQTLQSINNTSNSISGLLINGALSSKGVSDLQKSVSQSRQTMQQDLDALINNPYAQGSDVVQATARMNLTNVLSDTLVEAANNIYSASISGGSDVPYLDKDVVAQREEYIQKINNISVSGAAQDPKNAAGYKNTADLAKQAFDKALAQKLGCKNGIVVGGGITCAQ